MSEQPPKYRNVGASGGHEQLIAGLKPGAAVVQDAGSSCEIKIGGLERFRIYFEADVAGELAVEFLHANVLDSGVLTAGNPVAASVTANTELKIDVNPHFGETAARITFTPDDDGAVTTAEWCGVAAARR
jgi:hypothetical protein